MFPIILSTLEPYSQAGVSGWLMGGGDYTVHGVFVVHALGSTYEFLHTMYDKQTNPISNIDCCKILQLLWDASKRP
jgi:hypothetical protein